MRTIDNIAYPLVLEGKSKADVRPRNAAWRYSSAKCGASLRRVLYYRTLRISNREDV